MTLSPYAQRLAIFRDLGGDGRDSIPMDAPVAGIRNSAIRRALIGDVNAITGYRARCGPATLDTIRARFPNRHDDAEKLLELIDEDRDFIYTRDGLQILINRYLFEREPIQCCMLRIALNLSKDRPTMLKTFYDLLSCGFVHVSSIVAAADHVSNPAIRPGEACRLLVAKDGYDHNLVSQIERVSELISLGVGVGYGASNLPLDGKAERGKIRSGFVSLVRRLNACNYVFIHERKPKVALYIHVHNDTVAQALDIKMPSRVEKINNVFVGLMIPDYFMECVRANEPWYMFPGDLYVDGKNLADLYGDEYVRHYKRCVAQGAYTRTCNSRDLMHDILHSLVESGSPYVIWSDNLNEFNNQRAYGPIKTLNLCAEITNFSDQNNDSSCTLLSCNMAMFRDFPSVLKTLTIAAAAATSSTTLEFGEFEDPEIAQYAYTLGYHGTVMLNCFMGDARVRREIGLSPLGVYDMALIAGRDPAKVCAIVSEALYKGAVTASCDEYEMHGTLCGMYEKSMFAEGKPQFALRNVHPQSDWTRLSERMRHGMANSMLTAQAPTATTALLTGVTESVIVPMALCVAKESENGRNFAIPYGVMSRTMNLESVDEFSHDSSLHAQLSMYIASLPYVDHSQSVMLSMRPDITEIYDALVATYLAKFKTAVYYLIFRQTCATLSSVVYSDDDTCTSCTL